MQSNLRKGLIRSFFLGLSGFLCSPPIYFFPILPIIFSWCWYKILNTKNYKESFWYFCSIFFGFFIANFHWGFYPMLTNLSRYILLIIPGAILIPFLLTVICFTVHLPLLISLHKIKFIKNLNLLAKILIISLNWCLFEWLRQYWPFRGFPWFPIGLSFGFSNSILGSSYYIGRFGLNFLAISVSLNLLLFFFKHQKKKVITLINICIIALLYIFISLEHKQYEAKKTYMHETYRLIGIQGNGNQSELVNGKHKLFFYNYFHYTQQQINKYAKVKNTLIIWPETAIPFLFEQDYDTLLEVLENFTNNDTDFMFTTMFIDKEYKAWNATMLLEHNQVHNPQIYKKKYLVPFGEFIPFRTIMPKKLQTITGNNDINSYNGPYKHLKINGLTIAPLICYEVIFPGKLTDEQGNKPDLIINSTNEGWISHTNGFHQTYGMAKLKAMELRIPILRIANTGISSYIDPYGYEQVKLKPYIQDIIIVDFPIIKQTINANTP